MAFGIYSEKRFVAFTAEYENIFLNKIEHSDFYKETYFEDVVDGWYKGAGGRFQFGVEGGVTVKKKLDAHLEVKLPFTEKFDSYRGSPMHVNLGIAYRSGWFAGGLRYDVLYDSNKSVYASALSPIVRFYF